MPSPIAHSITGYVISKQFLSCDRPIQKGLSRRLLFVWAIVTANVADLDFISHLISGIDVHRGFTHSFVFGCCFSLLFAAVAHGLCRLSWKKLFLFTVMIYASHLLLDFFTAGGDGMQLLWPFSEAGVKSATPLFPGVHHSKGIFHWGHIVFITYESIYAIVLVKISNALNLMDFWKKIQN